MHGMHGNADASPAKILFLMFCFSQIIFFSRKFFLFHTECTEFFRQRLKDRWFTEFTLRVPSGFEFSPTDFLTRLLLCSAIRVNSIALAYRNNSQILLFRSFFSPTNLTNFTNLYHPDLFSSHKSHKFLQFAVALTFVNWLRFIFCFPQMTQIFTNY